MNTALLIEILLGVVGGLGVFLLGMKNLSEGIQAVSGDRLRKLIGLVTNNRIMAVLVGLLVTCLVQSSSITTVMVVGFVNSGFMTLKQAIGVIFGANIGTTITGWLISLLPKVGKYGLPLLGTSALFFMFARKEKTRFWGMTLMGLGMIFFGLELMSDGLKPLKNDAGFQAFFALFTADTYWGVIKCAVIGCLVTLVVQSSSATLGITMALLLQGSLTFETSAALVLGENIGTTITAYLASLGANTNAKRAAWSHIMFNVLGVCWATALFKVMLLPLSYAFMGPNPTPEMQLQGVAMVHTGFNVTNTILFVPMMGLLARLVTWMIPQKAAKEVSHLTYLNTGMLATPAFGVEQAYREVGVMADGVVKMLGYVETNLTAKDWDAGLEEKTFRREEILDNIQMEITVFLSKVLAGRVSGDVVESARLQIRLADEFESISDEILNVLKLHIKARKNELHFSEEGRAELLEIHHQIRDYAQMLSDALHKEDKDILTRAHTRGTQIIRLAKEYRRHHIDRLAAEKVPPLQSLIFSDVLSAYRRIDNHLWNVAEAIAGEK